MGLDAGRRPYGVVSINAHVLGHLCAPLESEPEKTAVFCTQRKSYIHDDCLHSLCACPGMQVPMGGSLVGGGCGDVRTKMVQMESMLSMQTAGCTAGNTSRHLTIVWGNLKQLHDVAGG